MDQHTFEKVFEDVMGSSKAVLVVKAGEYAGGGDRLHNFKKSAILVNGTPEQALWGFITKHLVSLSDMVYSGKDYPTAVWDEKIGDSLNYLILLKALIEEKQIDTGIGVEDDCGCTTYQGQQIITCAKHGSQNRG